MGSVRNSRGNMRRTVWEVYGTARNIEETAGLKALGERVSIHRLDVTDQYSIDDLVKLIEERWRMARVLISGANRGLGLEFSRQYAADGWDVIAACRNPQDAVELKPLGKKVSICQLDVADDRSIDEFMRALSDIPIDVVILNAGVGSGAPQLAAAVTREAWVPAMVVNTLAPLRLATGLRANLQKGGHKKAVGISSLAASIARYDIAGHYIYRTSKAALNSLWRSLAFEWRPLGIICIVLRPGKVRTRMTDFSGDLSPEESVRGMRGVIASATISDSGRFIGYDGIEVPW